MAVWMLQWLWMTVVVHVQYLVNIGSSLRGVYQIRMGTQYRVAKAFTSHKSQKVFHGRCELDSHADTFVAGSAIFGQPDYARVIAAMRAELAK